MIKFHHLLSSASGSVNQAEISIISNEIKSYIQPWKNIRPQF